MKTLKTVKKSLIVLMAGVCGNAMAEPISLLFVVEPAVYAENSSENVNKVIEDSIKAANAEFASFGVEFSAEGVVVAGQSDVSDALANGGSFTELAGPIMYSIGLSEAEYIEAFTPAFPVNSYNAEVNATVDQFHADHLIYVVSNSQGEVVGQAFQNKGVALSFASLASTDLTMLGHELGHLYGLGHPSKEECANANLLMCQGVKGSGLSESDKAIVAGVVAGEYPTDWWDTRFWNGGYNAPVVKDSTVTQVTVVDNPVPNTINSTDVVVELLDAAGAPAVYDKPVSFELYTKGSTAQQGTHYSDVIQRIEMLPGEHKKTVTLTVNHGASDAALVVGTRYGVSLSDSASTSVTIKAKEISSGGQTGGETSNGDSGGGAAGWLLLMCLPFLRRGRW